MAYLSSGPDYDVAAYGGFVGRDEWVVHATIAYRSDLENKSRETLEADARLDLLIGIARESHRGRDAGARSVHVLVQGDTLLAGLFRLNEAPSARASPASALRN